MWFPVGPGEKPKQLDTPTGLIPVPIDGIQELDRLQRLLSRMIELAVAVFNERIKAERASVNVRRLAGGGSGDAGEVAQWYELAEQVEEIASLTAPSRKSGALSKEVRESLDHFHEAREGASRVVQEIVAQVTASGTSSPGGDHGFATRRAIVKVRGALERCSSACDSESQQSLRQIEYRLHSFLERIEGQGGPSIKPAGDKQSREGLEQESGSSAGVDEGKLTEPGGDGDLKQQRER